MTLQTFLICSQNISLIKQTNFKGKEIQNSVLKMMMYLHILL
jgi:hypothetical protein